ncbi:nucleotide-binding universal stress UspA family protein [Gillisia mitskevichiae]|uniref:Nucleotide-binding universal stress UspA family protein n=2 Tax=Gillisia mitskevichiae TaxID=270921 RepID=A0A495PW49_9FLAO|nr:nucleotide-binding universal stress UspA family protein [Gillisia mitskevichiae]
MMNKILVPIDFSEHSEFALRVAAAIAKKNDSELVALHMLGISDEGLTRMETQELQEAILNLKFSDAKFTDFLDRVYLNGVKIQNVVQRNKDFFEIDSIANKYEAGLIVMGSHGSKGLNEVLVGSNTEKVVRTSTLPVLVIKSPVVNFKFKKVVFVCDFKEDYTEPFRNAWNFFKPFKSKFKMLYINLPENFLNNQEMEEKAMEFIKRAGVEEFNFYKDMVFYNDYNLENGIYRYANKFNADVVAVPTRGRRGIAHFFSSNKGESLVNHSNIPIITFKK